MKGSISRWIALGTIATALVAAAPAAASTLYVSPSGTVNPVCGQASPCEIHQGIQTVARDGDEVIVAPGTYSVADTVTIARRLDVHGDPAQPRPLIQKAVSMNDDPAVHITGAGARFANVDVSADFTFVTTILVSANATVENLVAKTTGESGEALLIDGGALVRNVVALSTGTNTATIVCDLGGTCSLRNVTAIGTGATSNALSVAGSSADARNVILRAVTHDASVTSGTLGLASSNFRAAMVQTGMAGIFQDGGSNQTGTDPVFFGASDFHQASTSITRNAGTVDPLIGATDIDGQPRSQEGAPDIGADEFPDLAPGPAATGNLLHNPGAEDGAGATDGETQEPIPGWTAFGAFNVIAYGAGIYPTTTEGARVGGGKNFFAGGFGSAASHASQAVDLSPYAADIDAGRLAATLRAELAGQGIQSDAASVAATFKNAAGATIGSGLALGPQVPADRGGLTAFAYREAAIVVPAGARSAEVTMTATLGVPLNLDGSVDGYVDNVALTLAAPGATSGPGGGGGAPGSGPGGGAPGAVDTVKPGLSRFGVSKSRFAAAGSKRKKRGVSYGTTLTFSLTEAARLAVTVERAQTGRRSGGKCVKSRRSLRRKARCTRYLKVGTLTYAGKAGANRVSFTGRVGGKALRTGTYRLSAAATDVAGNVSSLSRIAITIVRG